MGQLENDFVKELGPVEGRKAFLDRFASGMAATTSGQSPTTNYLMSHYLNYLEQTGKPMRAVMFADYGVNTINAGVIASKDLIAKNPGLIAFRLTSRSVMIRAWL